MRIRKQASRLRKQTYQVRKMQLSSRNDSESGFTIIEALIAVLVMTILLVAIAPVIAISVATRVQSRRVELATQAARAYIDAVRTQSISPPPSTTNDISTVSAPTASGSLSCPKSNNYYCTSPTSTSFSLYCSDFDNSGDCETTSLKDMVVQAFRHPSTASDGTVTKSYILGVRVYRADAFKGNATLGRNNATSNNEKVTQATYTGGAGQSTVPLVELTTEISDTVPKYTDLCTLHAGGGC